MSKRAEGRFQKLKERKTGPRDDHFGHKPIAVRDGTHPPWEDIRCEVCHDVGGFAGVDRCRDCGRLVHEDCMVHVRMTYLDYSYTHNTYFCVDCYDTDEGVL